MYERIPTYDAFACSDDARYSQLQRWLRCYGCPHRRPFHQTGIVAADFPSPVEKDKTVCMYDVDMNFAQMRQYVCMYVCMLYVADQLHDSLDALLLGFERELRHRSIEPCRLRSFFRPQLSPTVNVCM